jgi:hypothetical protein
MYSLHSRGALPLPSSANRFQNQPAGSPSNAKRDCTGARGLNDHNEIHTTYFTPTNVSVDASMRCVPCGREGDGRSRRQQRDGRHDAYSIRFACWLRCGDCMRSEFLSTSTRRMRHQSSSQRTLRASCTVRDISDRRLSLPPLDSAAVPLRRWTRAPARRAPDPNPFRATRPCRCHRRGPARRVRTAPDPLTARRAPF